MPFPLEKRIMSEKFYLVLPVVKPTVPEPVQAEAVAHGLIEKVECHISVAVEQSVVDILAAVAKSSNSEKIKEEIVTIFNNFSWEYDLTDTYSLQEKFYDKDELVKCGLTDEPEHHRLSIIQVVTMPDIELFYKKISALLNAEFTVPVPHITIFARSDYTPKITRGIGITSKEDLEKYNKKYL